MSGILAKVVVIEITFKVSKIKKMKFCKISIPHKNIIEEYVPTWYQQEFIDKLISGKNVILHSARLMGVTTTLFQYILNLPYNKPVLVLCCNEQHKKRFSSILRINELSNLTSVQFLTSRQLFNRQQIWTDTDVFIDNAEFMNISEIFKYFDNRVHRNCNIRFIGHTLKLDIDRDGFDKMVWPYTYNDEFTDENWISRMKQTLGKSAFIKEFDILGQ